MVLENINIQYSTYLKQIFLILHISLLFPDACNMELVGYLDLGQTLLTPNSDITGFEQDGREFAVVGVYDGVVFIDISDPSNPVKIKKINGMPTKWRDIKYWDRHVYIGA